MSDDQHNQPQSTPEPEQQLVPPAPKMTSRRAFLQAATIAGAGAVTAGSLMYATHDPTASRKLNHAIQKFTGNHPTTASGVDPVTMCFQDSSNNMLSSFTVKNNGNTSPGTFFLWFTVHSLPVGSYNLTFTLNAAAFDPTTSSTPFQLSDPGNNVFRFEVSNPSTLPDCPNYNAQTGSNLAGSYANLDSAGAANWSNPGPTGTIDEQLYVHLKWNGGVLSSNQTYTFVGTLTDHAAYSHSASVTVTAIKG